MNTNHLFTMTDNTGIIQHCKFSIPDLATGYTTDDNARALILACWLYSKTKKEKYLQLVYTYMSFMNYSLTSKGKFKNFMNYDRKFTEKEGSEDCFGRSVWAIGFTNFCKNSLPSGITNLNNQIIEKAISNIKNIEHNRSKAYTLTGLTYINKFCTNEVEELTDILANSIIVSISNNKSENWLWFENIITYGNGIIPYALLRAYEKTSNPCQLEAGLEILNFIDKIVFRDNYLKLIGCNGWYKKGQEIAEFDEQPVDAFDMILAYSKAYRITKKECYLHKAKLCYNWFHGCNSLNSTLIDNETGGCYDGLTSFGVNKNQGAESLLAYLLSTLTITSL